MQTRLYSDKEALSRAAAEAVAAFARSCIAERGRFTVALAGGSTPRRLYEILAEDYGDTLPWDAVHVFWGDERHVPHVDPKSNYRMAREALLDRVAIPPAHIHPIPTGEDPDSDAGAYARAVDAALAGDHGRFDLILLGLGDDGHTASLFPGSPALDETARTAVAAPAPVDPRQRITLTFPAINRARQVFFLVAGADKGPALACVRGERSAVVTCPAARVKMMDGAPVWFLDVAAAR